MSCQWGDHGHNSWALTPHVAQMMQYYDMVTCSGAAVKITEMMTLVMLLRWGQRSVCRVFRRLYPSPSVSQMCCLSRCDGHPGNCATLSSLVSSGVSVITWLPGDKLGHCSTHDPTTKLARVKMNMRSRDEKSFLPCVAIKNLKGFKTFECYGYDYHLCK